jgi:hypothetical protein
MSKGDTPRPRTKIDFHLSVTTNSIGDENHARHHAGRSAMESNTPSGAIEV